MQNTKKIQTTLIISIILLFAHFADAAPGDIDPTFNGSLKSASTSNIKPSVRTIVRQPDGKLLVGGNFTVANNTGRTSIARFNADGTIDTSFKNVPMYKTTILDATVFAIGVQTDGKIYVSGDFQGVGNSLQKSLIRLNADGTHDTSFQPNFDFGAFVNEIYEIVVQPDDKIVIGGAFRISQTGATRQTIARLNADGSIDASYTDNTGSFNVRDIELLADEKIVFTTFFSGSAKVLKVNSDGSLDASFNFGSPGANAEIRKIKVLSDGKMLIGGDFTAINGTQKLYISRLNADGTLDNSFSGPVNDDVFGIDEDANGKYLLVGAFRRVSNITRYRVTRLNNDGSIDSSFIYASNMDIGLVRAVLVLPNGQIIFGGDDSASLQSNWNSLLRLNSDGTLDSTVNYSIKQRGVGQTIYSLPDGKYLVGGVFKFANNTEKQLIVKFNADGTVDNSFNASAIDDVILDIEVQTDGKILIGGRFYRVNNVSKQNLARLNADGTLDTTFNPPIVEGVSSGVYKIFFQSDGKIIAAGGIRLGENTYASAIRLNPDGSRDNSFLAPNVGLEKIIDVAQQPDGKLMVVGDFSFSGSPNYNGVARLNTNGSIDSTFTPGSGANNGVFSVSLQNDGKIIIGGVFTNFDGNSNKQFIARLNSNGTLDNSFQVTSNGPVYDLLFQPSGKLLIAGGMTALNGFEKRGFGRLNSDGTVDTSFNVGSGANNSVRAFSLTNGNKIMIAGEFTQINNESGVGVARLLDSNVIPASTQYDFDGDGSADIGVFRPSSNIWYQLLGPNYNFSQTTFGIADDIVAPADFDGDGKSDLAIFRPVNGNWWYLSSVTNTQVNVQFGQAGDIPRPSDFDGDGKADFILFRPATSQWHRFGSTGANSTVSFGLTGDKPIVGDFDGDGKSDVAIYRPSTGDWWWQSSVNNGQFATHWGIPTDIPSPGDYDGDGITDFAVYRPDTGVWYIYNSTNGQATIIQFGISEDKPIPADYDGDGKTDIAVYRPSTGVWYLLRSTAGFQAIQFGIDTDIPIPNALIP